MTTENGLPHPAALRAHIKFLTRRRSFLEQRAAERATAGLAVELYHAEIAALAWAIPVLETEWMAAVRLTQTIKAAAEKKPLQHDLYRPAVATNPRLADLCPLDEFPFHAPRGGITYLSPTTQETTDD